MFDPAIQKGQEYWTGIVFSGDKIGFSHFKLGPSKDAQGRFDIESEAVFSFRLFMAKKKVIMNAHERVRQDFTLESFTYDYEMDGSIMHLTGELKDKVLHVMVITQGQRLEENIPVENPVYPASVMYLYPAVKGLKLGRIYEYTVYDGETRSVSKVHQEILAYEQSDLFEGKGFKMETYLHGQKATTWIDTQGRPLLDIIADGVLVAGLESEEKAKDYLVRSSVNKDEPLLDFSLIKTDTKIEKPRQRKYMEVALIGMDRQMKVISNEHQQCTWEGDRLVCRVVSDTDAASKTGCTSSDMEPYLGTTLAVSASNSRIIALSSKTVRGIAEPMDRIRAIIMWIQHNIAKGPVDVFTAVDVLELGKAECQGHAILYAALARAAGIPTKVVNGIVYSEDYNGFLYHTWAESCVGDSWVSIDPTFSQIPSDATHIAILEGENPQDLLPLIGIIGKVKAEVISVK